MQKENTFLERNLEDTAIICLYVMQYKASSPHHNKIIYTDKGHMAIIPSIFFIHSFLCSLF